MRIADKRISKVVAQHADVAILLAHRDLRSGRLHSRRVRLEASALRLLLPGRNIPVLALDLPLLQEERHERLDLCAEDIRVDRLDDVVDGAQLVRAACLGRVVAVSADEDDRGLPAVRLLSQARKHLEPVNLRHPDVRYDERDFFGECLPQPVFGVIGEEKIVAKGLEGAPPSRGGLPGCRLSRRQRAVLIAERTSNSWSQKSTCRTPSGTPRKRRSDASLHELQECRPDACCYEIARELSRLTGRPSLVHEARHRALTRFASAPLVIDDRPTPLGPASHDIQSLLQR